MNLPDLVALFAFNVNPLEIVLRGTVMYWFLFLMFRFVLRRDGGSIGIADVLLLVLVTWGRMLRKSMRRELITEEELWAKLREKGVSSLSEVASVFLVNSEEISVLKTRVVRGEA